MKILCKIFYFYSTFVYLWREIKTKTMEYFIKAVETEKGFDISNAILICDDGANEIELANGFHFVTEKQWKSTRACVVNFPVLYKEDDLLAISEETAKELLTSYTGGKLYISAEQRKASKEAGAWWYFVQNFITDPYCTR